MLFVEDERLEDLRKQFRGRADRLQSGLSKVRQSQRKAVQTDIERFSDTAAALEELIRIRTSLR